MRPTVLFTARLMPPRIVGGQEKLSADVLDGLREPCTIVDLSNYGSRATQLPYLVTLAPRIRFRASRCPTPVIVHGTDASLAGPLAASGVPSLLRVNGLDLLFRNPVYQAILRRGLPKIEQVVAISDPTADLAFKAGIPRDRVTVIRPSAEPPTGWNPEPQQGRILHVGRLVARKGVPEFIRDVWPRILREVPDARFDIVGDGADRDRMLAALEKAPARERITWHGKAPDATVNQLYRDADVFIMNNQPTESDFEGFGIVAIEASVRGLPVVARRLDGVVDAVVPGVTGSLVPAGDDAAFASEIVSVLTRRQFGDRQALRMRAITMWSPKRVADDYMAVIERMVRA